LNQELEERVAARTREIEASATELRRSEERLRLALGHAEQARAEAERANRLKDQFLAVLSHELRSPLSAILGWVHILKTGAIDDATRAKAIETISRNAHLQTRIISDILDVSSILAGKLRLTLEAVDLPAVAMGALDMLRPAAKAKNLDVATDFGKEASPIRGDSARLQQAVWNVLSNAIDFAPENGHVEIRLRYEPSTVAITVTDDGPGIRPDFLPFIFDRFRQEDSSSTRTHHGLGLGLAIVQHLVTLHGGSVTAANRTDRSGAVFTIVLPRGAGVAERADPSIEQTSRADGHDWLNAAPSLKGVRVLVVDDAADSREVAAEILRRCGADATVAASAREALEVVKSRPPNVILADIEMPDEDGYSFLRKVRALPCAIPVAALTAYASEEDRANVLAEGFTTHVPKPFVPLDLAKIVARLAESS
jgi:signal transduction histidine kinase